MSRAFSLGMPSVNPVLPASSENAAVGGLRRGEGARRRREARDWAGLQAASYPMQQQEGQEQRSFQDVLHQGVAADQSAPRWCTQRPEHPAPCRSPSRAREGGPIPHPHCPNRGGPHPGQVPRLAHLRPPFQGSCLICDLVFPKAGLPPPPPVPRGLLQPPLPNSVTRNAAPLLK